MARPDARYREAYNKLLDICGALALNDKLASEMALAKAVGVSRTVVRNALQRLHDEKIILWDGRQKTLIRKPVAKDRIKIERKNISIESLQSRFLGWVARFDVPPNTALNVAQLSKEFEVAPHTLQEFLASLSRFGLVERKPRGGWILLGFTLDYAMELSEFRTLLEMNAMKTFVRLPKDNPVWQALAALRIEHMTLLENIDTHYHEFSRLDEKFHRTINSVVKNRFVVDFQKVIALIFHYHYQWNKDGERQRNEVAVREHLSWIDVLENGDEALVEKTVNKHMKTSQETLLSSLRVNNLV